MRGLWPRLRLCTRAEHLSGPATLQLAELLAMTAVGTFRPDAQFREFWQEDPAMQAQPEEGVKEEPPCLSEEVIDLTSSDSASSSDEGSSAMRLILHAFEHTPLLNNVEEEFGNRSSFESQRVRVQANMADLNSALAQGEKERPLRELCFSHLR